MKKLLLCLMLASASFISFSQTVPLTKDWYIAPAAGTAVTINNSSIAYYNGKLYVADRNNKIFIVNPLNGSWSATNVLFTDPLWTESYKYTKIRVSSDGAIYAVAMGLVSSGSATLYIYKWDSDADVTPTRSVINVPKRVGESLAVVGTGTNATIYVSGATNNQMYMCTTTDGDTFTLNKTIVLNATTDNYARGSISPISDTEFIINGPSSVGIRKITIDKTLGTVLSTTSIPTPIEPVYSNAEYFEDGTRKYLTLSGSVIGATPTNNVGVRIRIYDITTITAPVLVSASEMFSATPPPVTGGSNPSGYADAIAIKNANGSHTFFHVVFGHGLASYTTDGTLPVSLSSFNAALVKGESTITWSTASETNNKGFEVLRSTDGKSFSVVDFVASKAANGNSSTSLNYSYVDRKAQSGISYYRLKQIDLNGTSELFDQIRSVDLKLNATAVQVYPNPATSYVKVKTSTTDFKNLKYDLFDLNGKLVLSEKGKDTEQELSLKGLAPSVYYLKVSTNTEQKMIKIIKN